MEKLKTLQETVDYIKWIHGKEFTSHKGVNCYASLRKDNGQKQIFSISKGVTITKQFAIEPDSLSIDYFQKKTSYNNFVSHQINIAGLKLINVYEKFTEYLTTDKIDFMYVIKGGANYPLTANWQVCPNLPFAQWAFDDDEYEIEDLNRTVIIRRKLPPMELDFS